MAQTVKYKVSGLSPCDTPSLSKPPIIRTLRFNPVWIEAGMFLSINHEANSFTVHELIVESERSQEIERKPYWLRRG